MRISLPPFLGPKKPFDRLRARLTRGLEISASKQAVARGDELEATVTITDAGKLGDIEVGLVCTEAYAVSQSSEDGHPSQGITWDTAYEVWVPVQSVAGEQTVRLQVPFDAPFSYAGTVLSFKWEVVARGLRKRRMDARASCDIEVQP
ncbi:MAG: hypothetical protein ACR2KK_04035 [Acidimicrobiales bacterium]